MYPSPNRKFTKKFYSHAKSNSDAKKKEKKGTSIKTKSPNREYYRKIVPGCVPSFRKRSIDDAIRRTDRQTERHEASRGNTRAESDLPDADRLNDSL